MRTGAIFARGSCRALKWMALAGMVLALGVGTASAQVTVTLASDEVAEGDRITINVSALVDITTDENGEDDIVVTVTPGAGTASTGKAEAQPADVSGGFAGVEITLDVPAAAAGATETVNDTLTGTGTITLIRDNDAEVEVLALTVTLNDGNGTPAADGESLQLATGSGSFTVTITERDTQVYTWNPATAKLNEGQNVTVALEVKHQPSQIDLVVDLALDPSVGYTLVPTTVTFDEAAGGDSQEFVITAPTNDQNRVDDTIELRALADGTLSDLADPLLITVTDIHGLPDESDITVKAYGAPTGGSPVTSVEEGDVVYLEVMVDRGSDGYPMGEKIEVDLSLSDS